MPVNTNISGTSEDEVTLNTVFSVLSHPARRRILMEIHGPPSQSVDRFELEDFVECDGSRERPAVELYHNHLPKLDTTGFVDWDDETNTVARGPRYEEIRPALAVLQANRDELPGDWP